MRRELQRAVFAAAALLMGCDDDDTGAGLDGGAIIVGDAGLDASAPGDGGATQPVVIRFKATVGSRELVCGQTYTEQGSTRTTVTPQDFRFFVEQVHLRTPEGREERVVLDEKPPFQTADVALLDFTDQAGSCGDGLATTTNMVLYGRVPPGTYDGVSFVIGVPETLNHAELTASTPAPLTDPSTYWAWLSGYRFFMAALGQPDLSASVDAGTQLDAGVGATLGHGLVHIGSTACTGSNREPSCAKPNRAVIRLSGFNPATSTVIADLGAVFAGVDLTGATDCHGDSTPCAPMFQALGIDIATGAPLATQSVFRVE